MVVDDSFSYVLPEVENFDEQIVYSEQKLSINTDADASNNLQQHKGCLIYDFIIQEGFWGDSRTFALSNLSDINQNNLLNYVIDNKDNDKDIYVHYQKYNSSSKLIEDAYFSYQNAPLLIGNNVFIKTNNDNKIVNHITYDKNNTCNLQGIFF